MDRIAYPPTFLFPSDYQLWLDRQTRSGNLSYTCDPLNLTVTITMYDGVTIKTDDLGHVISFTQKETSNEKKEVVDSDLDNRFSYHKPKEGQPDKYVQIRNEAKSLAETLKDLVPFSPELDHAIDKIDEAVMWANAGIARHG